MSLLSNLSLWGVSLVAAFLFGLGLGGRHANDKHAAQALKAAHVQAQVLEQARVDGEATAAALREKLAASERYQTTVESRIDHAPLLAADTASRCFARGPSAPLGLPAAGVHRPAAAGGAFGGGAADLGGDTVAGNGMRGRLPDAAAPPPAADDAGAADLHLSLAAVSLWNSALAGTDVPAGACRADDPASSACAAGSGVGLDDAWRNHAVNATACAQDRARLGHLIDYLGRRQVAR